MNKKSESTWFFLFKKSHLPPKQKKKNFIIVEQGGGLEILTTRDDNGGFGTRWSHPDLTRLFFTIPKSVPFKKLNRWSGVRQVGRDDKISKPARLHLIFIFIFYFIILKL